jgi:hypothetical protein
MTIYREAPGPFPVWIGEAIDGITHPLNIEQLWSAQELEAIGLWRDDMIAPADDVPEGKVSTGRTVERVNGVVTFVHVLEDAPAPVVPVSISMRQARLALLQAGLLSAVEAAINDLTEPDKSAARIEWEYATEMRRDHALIAALAAEMQLSEQQIDGLFIAAAAL